MRRGSDFKQVRQPRPRCGWEARVITPLPPGCATVCAAERPRPFPRLCPEMLIGNRGSRPAQALRWQRPLRRLP